MSFTNLDLEDFSNTNFTKVKQLTLYQKVYDLSIGSLTTTWRLAIRFTGLDNTLSHSNNSHDKKLFFFGPGRSEQGKDKDFNSNVIDQPADTTRVKTFIKIRGYKLFSRLNLMIQYVPEKKKVSIALTLPGKLTETSFLAIGQEYVSMTFISPRESDVKSIKGSVHITDLIEINNNQDPFKLRNVIFRLGKMFDYEVLSQTNYLILPTSSRGNATANVMNKAVELNISYPSPHPPAELNVFEIEYNAIIRYAGYAFTVDENNSSAATIRQICKSLNHQVIANRKRIKSVNLPLLGTGTGNIDEVLAAEFLVETLGSARFMNTIFVSILTPTAFNGIKHRFENKYIALRPERDFEKPTPVRIIGQRLRIKLERSDFQLNGEGEIVGLDLSKFKINQLDHFNDFPTLQSLNIFSQPIGDISFLAQINRFHS